MDCFLKLVGVELSIVNLRNWKWASWAHNTKRAQFEKYRNGPIQKLQNGLFHGPIKQEDSPI